MSEFSRASVYETEIETEIYQEIKADEDDNWRAVVRDKEYYIKHVERDGLGLALLDLKCI